MKMDDLWEELIYEFEITGNELLHKDKRKTYIGMGNRNAKILFIGNDYNLYYSEDYKVFPNSSGEFLLKLLDIAEIPADSYYVTTLSKKEEKFKNFSDEAKNKFIDLLFFQIGLIKPKIIVLLGKEVAEVFLKKEISLEKERGNFQVWKGGIETLIMYDIESIKKARKELGKNSDITKFSWIDFKNLKKRLDENE